MANTAVWFDIPATDLKRAMQFYSAVLDCTLEAFEFPGGKMTVFPHEGNDVAGCMYESDKLKPSKDGVLIYLNASGRLKEATVLVKENGGEVVIDHESLGEHGFRTVFIDTEGNQLALHSNA